MMIKHCALALAASVLAAPAAAAPIDRTIAAGSKGELEVDNVAGSVEITAWDRKEIHVGGELQADAKGLDVLDRHGRIVVRVVLPQEPGFFGYRGGTRLRISAPKGTSVDVGTVSADIDVHGIEGEQHLQSVSGRIETQGFERELDLKSISGGIAVDAGDKPIRVRASAVSGNVVLRGASGDVEAKSVSGRVELRGHSLQRAEVESISGSVDVQAGLSSDARVDATTTSGTIRLRFAGDAAAEYALSSFSGAIDNCFGPRANRNDFGPGRELRFTQGSGGPRVFARSMSGSIDLCKR